MITNETDYGNIYDTVNSALADADAFYNTNIAYTITIISRVLEVFESIATSGSTTTDSFLDVLDMFNLLLNKDASFIQKMNEEISFSSK